MRILIVEDDFDARMIAQQIVQPLGQVDVAVNGKEATRAFQVAHAEKKPYDVVLLDIMLPDLSGRDALREIRRMEENMGIGGLQRVGVIMVTALDDSQTIMDSFFRDGCEGYVTKPYGRDALLAEIRKLNRA